MIDLVARVAEDQLVRQRLGRHIEAGQALISHALDQRFELGLAVAIDRDLRAQLVLRLFELLGDDAVVGIQLGGELVLGDGFLEPSGAARGGARV